MKKIILTALAALLGTFMLAAPAHADEPVKIMIMGDSVTHGSNGDYTWRYHLDRHLRAAGTEFDFVGPRTELFSGQYADANFDRDHNALWGRAYAYNHASVPTVQPFNLTNDIMTYNPDIIISQMGVNDLMFLYTPQQLLEVVKGFIAEARGAKAGVDFVFGHLSWQNPAAEAYNALLPQLELLSTPESRIIVAPGVAHTSADTYDGVHPTNSGQVKIASMYKDALPRLGIETNVLIQPVVIEKPVAPAISLTTKSSESVVKWSKPSGVTKTRVWVKKTGGTWKVKKTVTTKKVSLPRRKSYSYSVRVQNYNEGGWGAYSKTVKVAKR